MSLQTAPAEHLIDSAEQALRRMRSHDDAERLHGFSALQMIFSEMMDRHRSRFSFLTPTPLSGLAAVIADAMWDEAGNRIGGPRTAAEAVINAGWREANSSDTSPPTRRLPPMWGLWLIDPSGTYGPHKAFFEHGETAEQAAVTAIDRYHVTGAAIDPGRPAFLAAAAQEVPLRSIQSPL